VSWSEVGATAPPPQIDDLSAYRELRAAIARYNDVAFDEVTPALGTSHAIFLAYAAMLSPGDDILVETPGYEPLTRAAEGLGATVCTFRRELTEGFRLVPERVAAAMTPRTRAIVVSSLHNPTGVRADTAALRELASIAEARSAYLLVDEVYAPFDDLPEDGVFRRSARKLAPNVITVASLTKCYGLGMYRIGWLLGPEAIVAAAEAASIATVGHLPLAHASYGVTAFGAIGSLARRATARMAGKRLIAERWASSLRDAHWSAPAEGLFGLVTLHGRGDLRERIEASAREAGVLVGAGSFFGAPESFRLSWANGDTPTFEEGLARLERLTA
jgi:aspartate/methionine/tyrosine aminotransferase